MLKLKASSARNLMLLFVDSTDHVSGKTGLSSFAITVSKNGAAFGSTTPAVTERGNGWYNFALTSSDTDTLGCLVLRATATGADPAEILCEVVAYDQGDSVRLGLSSLPNANANANGGLPVLTNTTLNYTVSTVTTLTNYTTPPATSAVASAVRTELSTELARLDVAVGSRSTYGGGDTSGTTTLLSRLTDARATKIDNLDATILSRQPSGDVTVATASVNSIRSGLALEANATSNTNALGVAVTNVPANVWGVSTRSLTDKAGFKLASDGLDSIPASEGTGVATTYAARCMQTWARFYRKVERTSDQIRVYRSDGATINTTQNYTASTDQESVAGAV